MNNEVIGDFKNAICLLFPQFLISQGSVATCLRWSG